MDILSIINKLESKASPSGFEHAASKSVESLMARFLDKTEVDSFGNVYGFRRAAKKTAKTLLLDAHIDEIGLIVTGSKDRFLTFTALGGVDPRILPAREVSVLTTPPRHGIICTVPPHLQAAGDEDKVCEIKNLYIDIGAESDETPIPIGTPVVFDSSLTKLRENYISARALDDRASLAAIFRAVELLSAKKLDLNIVVVASTQEELGLRGARCAAFGVNPDYAIVVDVTHATTPDSDKSLTFKAGSGVAIGVGPNMTKKMSDALLSVAVDKKIPHTIEVCSGNSGTNAWVIQNLREGIPTGLLSIPLKYMHTPVETVKKNDIEATAKLICEFASNLSSGGGKL